METLLSYHSRAVSDMPWVYFMGEATEGKIIKIGTSKNETLVSRLQSVNSSQQSNERFVLLAGVVGEPRIETTLKKHFAGIRQSRGPRQEYFHAEPELVEYVLWLRNQYFVTTDPAVVIDDAIEEDPNLWLPQPGRRVPPPPDDPDALFSPLMQLSGPLAGTEWAWMPDPLVTYQDYFTPPEIVSRAWDAMGAIDLDAASHKLANKRLNEAGVPIRHFFTRAYNAFEHPWCERVWLNPPYGENLLWFSRFASEMGAGRVKQLCMLSPMWAFSTIQAQPYMASASAMVVLSPTPKFYNPGDPSKTGINDPHAVVYWGDRPREFLRAFADIGIPCQLELGATG